MRGPVLIASLTLAVLLALVANPRAQQESAGRIEFPTGQGGAAQEAFIRGVLLLHAFEYQGARDAFVQARAAAPGFVLASWGEAMTYHHPLWAEHDAEGARQALSRLAATREQRLGRAAPGKERDWLRAVEILSGDEDAPARDAAYAAAMRQMYEKYPDDLEVKAFYALAVLGTGYPGRDLAASMRAAAVAEDVVRANPRHPGAVHYLIHAYDDPAHAPLGLRYADTYATIAPEASYALHVPSHIYVALGLWDKASELNERSARAAGASRDADAEQRAHHAWLWLVYSYLQQGRQQEARAVLERFEQAASEGGSASGRTHLALARAVWLVETRRWADARRDGVNPEGLPADATAADLLTIGMAAIRSGNRAEGADALQRMAALAGDGDRPVRSVTTAKPAPAARPGSSRPGVTPIPTSRPSLPTPAELMAAQQAQAGQPRTEAAADAAGNARRRAAIMAQQLEAVLIFSEGRRDEGLVLARQAAVVEDTLPAESGPPLPVKPGHELVGDLLMDARRPGEAVVAYATALRRHPGRALSLLGLYRSATASRQAQKAQQAAADLRRTWQSADKSLPELREVAAVPPPGSW